MPDILPILLSTEPGWTTSNYMPDVKVEIAFGAGYSTPAASRVWTDVSEWVELDERIRITVGRQDELSTAGPNGLTLTLDNSDGRFTAGRSGSPYYPNVKIGRPIRVSVMTVTGHTSVRFIGFIDEWPVEWEDTDAYAKARISAHSRLSRLGLSTKLRSIVEEAHLQLAPAYYYTLGEATGASTASDTSGSLQQPLRVATTFGATPGPALPTFGTGTGSAYDELPAVQFPADSYPLLLENTPVASSWVTTFSVASAGAVAYLLRVLGRLPTVWVLSAEVSATGVLLIKNSVGTTLVTGPNVADGATHALAVTLGGGNVSLYLDGTSVGAAALSTPTPPDRLLVGGVVGTPGVTMCHVAGYVATLTSPEVADLADVILTGLTGERTDQRAVRLLGWAGVPLSEVTAQAGAETMTHQLTAGQSVTDALRDVESTESGVLFDGRDGNVVFHNRSNRYLKTAAATLDMAAQHVGADYRPKLDRSTLRNDATAENPVTEQSARQVSQDSQDEYGVAAASATVLTDDAGQLEQHASWAIASYAEPRSRVPSLTVNVLAHVEDETPTAESLLDVDVSDRLDVTNAPTQADTTSASYFVEGYTEVIGPELYEITFNLSPTYPALNTWVVGDPIRGQLDGGSVLAL